MVTLNKVMLIGNLTADPALRSTPAGTPVCEFTLALNRRFTNRQTQQPVEEVSFIDVVTWGRTAEVCAEYLKKGRAAYVEGRLTQSRWEADGKKLSRVRVTAENVQFMGGRPAAPQPAGPAPAPDEGETPGDEPLF